MLHILRPQDDSLWDEVGLGEYCQPLPDLDVLWLIDKPDVVRKLPSHSNGELDDRPHRNPRAKFLYFLADLLHDA